MFNPEDFLLSSYDYELPPAQIAQFPAKERSQSRLMVMAGNQDPVHAQFKHLAQLLPDNSLLVANNSRVIPARLLGQRPTGGKAELLILTPLPLMKVQDAGNNKFRTRAHALIRPAAKIKCGDIITFSQEFSCKIRAKGNYGHCAVELTWQGDLALTLNLIGNLPLPPYIRRSPLRSDRDRYQTIYASQSGSVAAPTAGLHFTDAVRRELEKSGHEWTEITLHVGCGTFSPVRCDDIRSHKMHPEYVHISDEAAAKINQAKKAGRPIIAVGTTSMRSLEAIMQKQGAVVPYSGMVNIFLYPGQPVRFVDGLLTNFHLPKSTLLMLVAAIAGRKRILSAYNEAVREGYRFFSYGDAMLIY